MSFQSRREFLKTTGYVFGAATFLGIIRSCERKDTRRLPNLVFLFSDDHSVPDLGCYGNQHIHTPNLDNMAAQGIRFNRAYVSSSQCSPSRASILTGRAPHDVHASRLHSAVPPYEINLVQLLKDKGYHTGAYRKVHQPNIQNDFDFYGGHGERLTRFFDTRPEHQPFFLWFGSTDPHRSYEPGAFEPPHDPNALMVPEFLPDTPEVRQDLAYYYDEIARFDQECGEILELLERHNLTENTLVVMAGDNGLPFPRAKATLYEAGINVPLLIRWPGRVRPEQVTEELVSLTDLTATWLEAAGVRIPEIMQSRSLVPLITGNDYQSRQYIFAERNWHDNWDPMRCAVGQRYKLIQNYRPEMRYIPSLDLQNSPSYAVIQSLEEQGNLPDRLSWYTMDSRPQVEFYNLDNDPGEWNNLAQSSEHEDPVIQYQEALSRWMEETHDFLPPPRGAFPGGPDSELNKTINPVNGIAFRNE